MNIKGLQTLDRILIESELVQVNNDILDVVSADQSSWVEDMDKFLDSLIDNERRRLNVILDLDSMSQGVSVFLDEKTLKNVLSYVKYTKSRLAKKIEEFQNYARAGKPEQRLTSAQLAKEIIIFNERLQSLQLIYDKINSLISNGQDPFKNSVLTELYHELEIQKKMMVTLSSESSGEIVSTFSGFPQRTDIEQDNITKKAASVALALNKVSERVDDEPTKRKVKFYGGRIFDEYLKNGGYSEKYQRYYKTLGDFDYLYLEILDRIEKIKTWNDPNTFDSEVHKIITSITSSGKVFSESVVNHLSQRLAEAISVSKERLDLKKASLNENKGIKFVFEKRLPLFESIQLPVTAQQIAETSFLNRVHKFLDKLGKLMPALRDTEMDKAMVKLGDTIKHFSAPILHKTAGDVGNAIGGKEGKIKGQSIVHSVFKDKYLNEEGAPGMSMQTPDSVSSMGPITPPTQTTLGSGDKFGTTKKYKRRKKQ